MEIKLLLLFSEVFFGLHILQRVYTVTLLDSSMALHCYTVGFPGKINTSIFLVF